MSALLLASAVARVAAPLAAVAPSFFRRGASGPAAGRSTVESPWPTGVMGAALVESGTCAATETAARRRIIDALSIPR